MPKGKRKVSPRKVASKKSRRLRLKTKQQSNPFNRITAKNLHNAVIGQRIKGNVKRPGHSISRSIEKRKRSLLKEYTAIETNQHNTFIDKRYEKTLETKLAKLGKKKLRKDQKQIEKMIQKLTSQRLKSNKKVSFNLDDEDAAADDFTLTHLGAPINEQVINLSNEGIAIDEEDDDNKYLYKGFNKQNIHKMIKDKGMDFKQIAEAAGVSLNKFENKTKPQLIKQQILRSRYKKCMAQIATEDVVNETDAVDDKYKETMDWLFANRSKHNTNDYGNMQKAMKRKKLDLEYQQKLIEFEKDARSGVTDRMVTDAQKAQKNYQLLCEMETKRKRKQLGLPSDSEEDEDLDITAAAAPEDDGNMDKLEAMFDRAQKGYSDEENEGHDADIMDGERDTNWDQLLEDIADNEGSDEEEEEEEGKIEGDNDEIYGYDADIDAQFIPKKKAVYVENRRREEYDEEIEIGAEPAGKGEESVFDIERKKEISKKEQRRKEKLQQKRAATMDFDIERNVKQKEREQSMNDNIEWNVLELNETQDLVGSKLNQIPFTLEVPENIEEFEALMADKSASQQITLLKRMRSTNHVKLNEDNKVKIMRLYDMLLDYFRKLCLLYEPTKRSNVSKVGALQNDIGFYQYMDVVTRALFALSHDIPQYAYSVHMKKLEMISMHIQKNYNVKSDKQYNEKQANDDDDASVSFMPSGYALFYLKLVSHIFPKEHKANPVTSAVLLILCKIITDIRVNGARDIVCYLYCITLILEMIKKEKRYVPEVIHSLHNVLRAGFLSNEQLQKSAFDLLSETNDLYFTFGGACNLWNDLKDICANDSDDVEIISLPLRWIFLKQNDELVFHTKEFKIQSLHALLTVIFKSHQIWSSLLAYSEIFKPFYTLLNREDIKTCICSSNCVLSDLYSNVQKCLKERIKIQSLTRKPLQLIHRKRAIPSLEPDFDPNLKPSFLRLKVRNETALRKKQKRVMKKAIKKQQKAVMNEFRKDTEFIMNEKTKHRIEADNKRKAKWEHEWHNLTEQQRDTNSFQMVGKKLKKRLMKKGVIRGF